MGSWLSGVLYLSGILAGQSGCCCLQRPLNVWFKAREVLIFSERVCNYSINKMAALLYLGGLFVR